MGKFNIGAVKYLWLFSTDEVTVVFTGNVFSSCSLNVSASLSSCLIDDIAQTILPEVVFDDDDNGGIWSISLSGKISEIDSASRAIADKALRPCIAVVENMIGDMFLLGLPDAPLTPAKVKRSNPDKIASATSYDFDLAGISVFQPPMVSAIST